MAKKIMALFPSEREKECDHPCGFAYRGKIPCTGMKVCPMCLSEMDPKTGKIYPPRKIT